MDDKTLEQFVIGSYSTQDGIPSVEEVYALHSKAASGKSLVQDRVTLEREVVTLVLKANGVYEKVLEIINASGF